MDPWHRAVVVVLDVHIVERCVVVQQRELGGVSDGYGLRLCAGTSLSDYANAIDEPRGELISVVAQILQRLHGTMRDVVRLLRSPKYLSRV